MASAPTLRTPWTTDSVLDDCVYVLTRQYVKPIPSTSSVCFYAGIGSVKQTTEVTFQDAISFLRDHRDHRFVTYDAASFHRLCMKQAADHEQRSVVWQFSRNSLLWDVDLIERRIRYAHNGEQEPVVDEEGLDGLFERYVGVKQHEIHPDNQVRRLREILVRQLDRAVRELPIFKKWDELTVDEYVGSDASSDDYLRAVATLERQEINQQNRVADHYQHSERRPHPSEFPQDTYSTLDRLRASRRQNLVLTASRGPLGVGLDLQDALLADTLNSSICPIVPSRLEDVTNNLYLRACRDLESLGSEAKTCFQWQGKAEEKEIRLDKSGYARKNDKKLQAALEKEVGQFQRVCKIPLDYPRKTDGSPSLKYVDWLSFRHCSRFVKSWTDLEVSGVILAKTRKKEDVFRDYRLFPRLKSATVDVFTESVKEFFLTPRPGNKFVEIRLDDLFLRSALAVNVTSYGLSSKIRGEPYADENRFPHSLHRYFVENIDRILNVKQKDPLVWNSLSNKIKYRVIDQMAESGVNQESADSAIRRLRAIEVSMPPQEVTYLRSLIWELLVHGFPPKEYHLQETDSRNYFSPGPDVTERTSFFEVLPWLDNSLRLSEILFQVAVNHFSYRFSVPRTQLSSKFFNEIKSPASTQNEAARWSIVDRLDRTVNQVRTLLAISYNVAFDRQAPYVEETLSSDDLFKTNGVSCLGRVGEPIHYANVISADIELFRRDVASRIAFDLLAEGFDVVWVSDHVLIVQLPAEGFGTASNEVAKTARQTAAEVFQAASILKSGFASWLARGLCQFEIADRWPRGAVD